MPLLSLPLLLFGLSCLWLVVRRRLLPERGQLILAMTLTFGLSLGGLTLWMLFLGLFFRRALSPVTVLIFPAAMWLLGLRLLIAHRQSGRSLAGPTQWRSAVVAAWRELGWGERWLLLALAGSLAVSLIHSLYYPFVGEDEVSRYAYFARLVFEARSIPDSVSGYPLLLPLGYAYAFFVGGGLSEHLAKSVSWAFAPATVAATYCLASTWAGRRAGVLAAFTLAVTRLFVDWSPMGYVDIATGLYATLSGALASLWLQRGELRHAVLAGLAAGLALWTKQSGFAILFSLAVVFLAAGVFARERRDVWGQAALALGAAALVALPWYARNAAIAGWENAVPAATDYYYSQARRSLLDWLPFLSWAKDFGYGVAPLYLGGVLAGLALLARPVWPPILGAAPVSTGPMPPKLPITNYTFEPTHPLPRLPLAAFVQWAFILPYLGLWWAFFSYEPRFLLTVLPFYAALVGLGFEWLSARVRLRPQPLAVAALAVVLLAGGVYARLGGVYRLLTAPLATDQEKLLQYKPDVASTVAFLRQSAVPGRDRIYSMDPRLAYYLTDYGLTAGYPTSLAALEGYDYLVAGSWATSHVYPRLGQAGNDVVTHLDDPQVFELLFTSELGTVKVYRVLPPSSQAIR